MLKTFILITLCLTKNIYAQGLGGDGARGGNINMNVNGRNHKLENVNLTLVAGDGGNGGRGFFGGVSGKGGDGGDTNVQITAGRFGIKQVNLDLTTGNGGRAGDANSFEQRGSGGNGGNAFITLNGQLGSIHRVNMRLMKGKGGDGNPTGRNGYIIVVTRGYVGAIRYLRKKRGFKGVI